MGKDYPIKYKVLSVREGSVSLKFFDLGIVVFGIENRNGEIYVKRGESIMFFPEIYERLLTTVIKAYKAYQDMKKKEDFNGNSTTN